METGEAAGPSQVLFHRNAPLASNLMTIALPPSLVVTAVAPPTKALPRASVATEAPYSCTDVPLEYCTVLSRAPVAWSYLSSITFWKKVKDGVLPVTHTLPSGPSAIPRTCSIQFAAPSKTVDHSTSPLVPMAAVWTSVLKEGPVRPV